MKSIKMVVLAAALACLGGLLWGQGLEAASPESQGVSSGAILRWVEACESTAATNGFKNGHLHGFVILRHGRMIAEGTWAPQNTLEKPHMLYSHSKSARRGRVGGRRIGPCEAARKMRIACLAA